MSEKRMVDKNGMRGGAGLSAVLLLVAFVFQWRAMVPAISSDQSCTIPVVLVIAA